MDPSTLLNRPTTTPKLVAKITKINNLVTVSTQARKSSTKLVKVFEKGTYQKKTQLTVLNRYKKRLETIQKQNDRSFRKKQKVKVKLPDIKKYVGNFFTPGSANDPFKAIGALAAFKALQKGSKGDYLGALGPALVVAGIALGPSLLRGGVSAIRNKGAAQTTPQIGAAGASAGSFWGTPYSQTAAGRSYASMQQFRNLPKWAQGMSSSSAGRFSASSDRIIQGTANIGDRLRVGTRGMGMQGVGGIAENVATAKPSISPRIGLLNAALFGLDFMGRKSGGQSNIQAGVGAGAGVGGALIGAAIGSALFPGVGTVAGLLIGAAFSTGGALIASSIADKITGVDKLEEQTEKQKKEVERKRENGGALTFRKTLNSYEKAVNKFEEFSRNFTPSTRAKSTYVEGREPAPPPPPPGQNIVADTQVVQDAVDFRNQFPLGRGTPNVSMTPYELHLRENTMLHAAGIGNDPTVERVHVEGSAHYSNRAIDIPVNSKPLGDRVAQFWRSRGYYVIWQSAGHYNHVHVQWNAGSPQAGAPSNAPAGASAGKGYIIIPGHATGGGAPGEKALVKKLAIDAYNKIKKQNPSAPVQYMDLDATFSDDDAGWNQQKKWYENMERQGYQVLEIHMDQKGGIGKGVIRSHGQQSAVSNAWINQGNRAYPMDWRSKPGEQPLAGPHRGVDLFELGNMKSGAYSQSEINALTAPFVSSVLSSVRGAVRQTNVPLATNLPYQQGYRAPQPTVIPYPVIQQSKRPQMMSQGSSEPEFVSGPSEEQVLNSFYKKVLLNSLL